MRKVDLTQPSWQVKYEDYGGLKVYTTIRNMYWNISRYYIGKEGKYNATNFPLIKCEPSVRNLLEQFRRDLKRPIHHYD